MHELAHRRYCRSLMHLAVPARAEEPTLEQLVHETQQFTEDGPQHLMLVWWLPTEFWNRSAGKNPNVTPEMHEQLLSVVRQYAILHYPRGARRQGEPARHDEGRKRR